MDWVGEFIRKKILEAAKQRESVLRSAILEKLCDSGRILPSEHIATIQVDNGSEEYYFPNNNEV